MSTKTKFVNWLCATVAFAAIWLAVQAVVNVLNQLMPSGWDRYLVISVTLVVAVVVWPVLARLSMVVFALAFKIFTGKWYAAQTHQPGA